MVKKGIVTLMRNILETLKYDRLDTFPSGFRAEAPYQHMRQRLREIGIAH